jgi:hypothetical protein
MYAMRRAIYLKAVLHLLVCGWSCEDGAWQVEFFR